MVKSTQILLLFLGYFLFLFHDITPHHHQVFDHNVFENHQTNSHEEKSGTNEKHHIPFPAHQHLSDDESFDIFRPDSGLKGLTFTLLLPVGLAHLDKNLSQSPNVLRIVRYCWLAPPFSSFPEILPADFQRGSPSA